MKNKINNQKIDKLLSIQDLTLNKNHAIHLMVERVCQSLPWQDRLSLIKGDPVVLADHNYRLLGYASDAVVQESTYTHWVDDQHMLRTQTTSLILQSLIELSKSPYPITLVAPGMVYRRDVRDRWHTGQPHQIDIWRLVPKGQHSLDINSILMELTSNLLGKKTKIQLLDTEHPYTIQGKEVSAWWQNQWLEIGEAGLICPELLSRLNIDPDKWEGVAMGWGLDRLVMVAKNLPDIRLLRDGSELIVNQMTNLKPWKSVSKLPHSKREISIALEAGLTDEDITERILSLLGEEKDVLIQDISIAGRWSYSELPTQAIEKLGMLENQENILVKITWQSESDMLPREQVNEWMRELYLNLHKGSSLTYLPAYPTV